MPEPARIWKALMMAGSIALGVTLLILLAAAMQGRNAKPCAGVQVSFSPADGERYTGKAEVLKLMDPQGLDGLRGRPVKDIDLRSLEDRLERHPWVRNAELYFDNNRVLRVQVEEYQPIARVFTASGQSFYIDSNLQRLPLNERITPRLPVFTGFPSDRDKWKGKDSVLIAGVKDIACYLQRDSFWMAMVDQVDINADRAFELFPKIGEHQVVFGEGQDVDDKFHRLTLFYQQVLSRTGMNAYRSIDVRFAGQIVAVPDTRRYARTDTALYRQWYRQWQSTMQLPTAASSGPADKKLMQEAPDHASPKPTNPVKTTDASTKNPVPGKLKDSGKHGALPAEKTGPKAVMPPSVKTS
jgi:cell division protein FtsQ